ncbi:hypothetical protein HZB07_03380 [Candidatus Saganbacteria bacterium]|nr:hypothetical protein [Candidatus Saganbacteria bacterium]
MSFDLKRVYYYIICLVSFFVLMWGIVDLTSATTSFLGLRSSSGLNAPNAENSSSPDKSDQFFDAYYQTKMLYDRLWDSLARIIVAGTVFAYSRRTVDRLEKTG